MIMKSKLLIAVAMLFLSPLAFACNYPARVDMPNGTTASKDEMLAGQKSVKDYMAAMEEYLACIEDEEKDAIAALIDASDGELATRDTAITKKYNAAVQEMELIAAKFNDEVRDYKDQGN
jgi:hypothetical protein